METNPHSNRTPHTMTTAPSPKKEMRAHWFTKDSEVEFDDGFPDSMCYVSWSDYCALIKKHCKLAQHTEALDDLLNEAFDYIDHPTLLGKIDEALKSYNKFKGEK